jgi:hypothetical protein
VHLQSLAVVYARSDLDRAEKSIAAYLAFRANRETALAWPSIQRIASDTAMTRQGVIKVLARLLQKGAVECLSRGGGRGRTTYYRLIVNNPNQCHSVNGDDSLELEKQSTTFPETVNAVTETVNGVSDTVNAVSETVNADATEVACEVPEEAYEMPREEGAGPPTLSEDGRINALAREVIQLTGSTETAENRRVARRVAIELCARGFDSRDARRFVEHQLGMTGTLPRLRFLLEDFLHSIASEQAKLEFEARRNERSLHA